MATTPDYKIVLGLDIPKTIKKINTDLQSVIKKLTPVKLNAIIDENALAKMSTSLNTKISLLEEICQKRREINNMIAEDLRLMGAVGSELEKQKNEKAKPTTAVKANENIFDSINSVYNSVSNGIHVAKDIKENLDWPIIGFC